MNGANFAHSSSSISSWAHSAIWFICVFAISSSSRVDVTAIERIAYNLIYVAPCDVQATHTECIIAPNGIHTYYVLCRLVSKYLNRANKAANDMSFAAAVVVVVTVEHTDSIALVRFPTYIFISALFRACQLWHNVQFCIIISHTQHTPACLSHPHATLCTPV